MLKKLNIKDFGSYQNFIWDENIQKEFGNRNIIYGRNYSGKTTLSRIFRSLEKQILHEDFRNSKFELILDDNQTLSESQIENTNLNVRVYNSDYRKENLSILSDKNGDIVPFTILGEKNIEIEEQIKEAQEKIDKTEISLGSNQEEKGLIWDHTQLNKSIKKLEVSLLNKMTKKASDIKRNKEFFQWSQKKKEYNRADLEKEIQFAKALTNEEREEYKKIVRDKVKENIPISEEGNYNQNFDDILKKTTELLVTEIKPSKSIEYLINSNELQEWVQKGVALHRGKRSTCAFCQSELNDELWEKIDAHFTKESEEYKEKIVNLIEEVNCQIDYLKQRTLANKEQLYANFQEKYDQFATEWGNFKSQQLSNLHYILLKLEKKQKDIFSVVELEEEEIIDISEDLEKCEQRVKEIIRENNEYSKYVFSEKDKARTYLRLDEIYNYLDDIDYKEQQSKIDTLKTKKIKVDEELNNLKSDIENLNDYIKEMEGKIKDEAKAVEQINLYLRNFLGHPELSLEVVEGNGEEMKGIKFSIKRNGELAYNLSEGEQSLIAFCYFLSTLKDISNPEDYIIFIDDPISSLDGNNLFYIFSLIDLEIAQKSYEQLFISTHNLDLLKYLQRITKPTGNDKWENSFFVIEKRKALDNAFKSHILEMPNYLRRYATEFTYLFGQIAIIATEEQDDTNYHSFYSFPNIARRFLESYLFFKYPDHTLNTDKRLKKFFGDNVESVPFINRINNEFSHGENQFDRLEKPIDMPEFKKDAKLILKRINDIDKEQFDSLCNSVEINSDDLRRNLTAGGVLL